MVTLEEARVALESEYVDESLFLQLNGIYALEFSSSLKTSMQKLHVKGNHLQENLALSSLFS